MDENSCTIFEGFGTCGTSTTCQPQQDEKIADWTDALVSDIFNDPDCERLQVASIISAIREFGFPVEYENKLRDLEQQLDPRNEYVAVDESTCREVLKSWLISCQEEKNTKDPSAVEVNRSSDDDCTVETSSYVDVHPKKDGNYKNEIYDLHTTLNGCEDKIKVLQLDKDGLQKSLKKSQAALQKAQEDKALAEESKAAIEETLKIENSRRRKEIADLEKQLGAVKDHLEILTKDNYNLSERSLGKTVTIDSLQSALMVKSNEIKGLVKENNDLKICLEHRDDELKEAEEEINRLRKVNYESVEHGNEWKKTIQKLREEKELLSKRLLILSARIKTGKKVSSSVSDFGSDTSSVGEVSIFSPACFSSPLPGQKLNVELAGTVRKSADMESTKRIPRPVSRARRGTRALIPEQKCMRKRKLFPIPALETNRNRKRLRSDSSEDASVETPRAIDNREGPLAMLPLERSTSFAINLTVHQKLLESLRQALCLHPHLFGCLRDFVACQIPNSTSGTELTYTDLTSLFYEFCTAQLSMPFRGRQFLRVICEEPSTQSSVSASQRCHVIDPPNYDETSQHTQVTTYVSDDTNAVQTMYPLAITDRDPGFDSINAGRGGQHIKCSGDLTQPDDVHNLKCLVSEIDTISSSANREREPPSFAGEELVEISNTSDVVSINDNCVNHCVALPNTLEHSDSSSEQEFKSLLGNPDDLMPTNGKHFETHGSCSLIGVKPTCSQEPKTEGCEGERQAIDCIDSLATDILPKNVNLLCDSVNDMIVEFSTSSSAVIDTLAPCKDAVNNETLHANAGRVSSDESNEEFLSSQCLSIDPSFELYSDGNSEQLSISVIDSKILDSQLDSGIVSPHRERVVPEVETLASSNPASPPDSVHKHVKESTLCAYFKSMIKCIVFICFLLLFLFFALIFLAKAILPEKDYISLLLALSGKYHRHETQLF